MKTEHQIKSTYQSVIREQSGVELANPDAITRAQAAHENAIKSVLKVQWLQDEMTQQMLRNIDATIFGYEHRATALALEYHKHQNHLEIINLLVRAEELRKQKQQYVSSNNQ